MFDSKDKLDEYLINHSSPEDEVLAELNRTTHLKVLYPRMLSGQIQGKLLEMISRMIRPKRILEIGMYTGYSAICLARGLAPDGKLITTEINDEIIPIAEKYIGKAGLTDRIDIKTGDALEIIPKLDGPFDLVFIDAEKKDYISYYNLIIDKVCQGGFILADNVLWDGKVLQNRDTADKETMGIMDFNKKIVSDNRVETIILPVRDGLSLIRKKQDCQKA